jgi:hypothetical protein
MHNGDMGAWAWWMMGVMAAVWIAIPALIAWGHLGGGPAPPRVRRPAGSAEADLRARPGHARPVRADETRPSLDRRSRERPDALSRGTWARGSPRRHS